MRLQNRTACEILTAEQTTKSFLLILWPTPDRHLGVVQEDLMPPLILHVTDVFVCAFPLVSAVIAGRRLLSIVDQVR